MPYARTDNIAGVVLAGGRSSRMGENKALLDFHGKPLVDHMIDLLHQSGVSDVYVSGDLEGYNCIPDQAPYAGPAAAMAGVLDSLKEFDGVVFVPVDMPLLTPEVLQGLMQHDEGAYYEGWPVPTFLSSRTRSGIYAKEDKCSMDPGLRRDDDSGSVRGLLRNLGVRSIPMPDEFRMCFINVNTPEQWKAVI